MSGLKGDEHELNNEKQSRRREGLRGARKNLHQKINQRLRRRSWRTRMRLRGANDETMAPLWRGSNETSWAWQIEGGLSQRWGLRKGVVLDLGTRDDNNELRNFND